MPEALPFDLPPREAVEYFRRKGLRPSWAWEDVYAEEHARVFTVAKAMQIDVLEDIRTAVDRAIAEGTTLAEFRRELTPQLQERGWWGRQSRRDPRTGEDEVVQLGSPRRLRTIYEANLRSAYAAGRWEQIERTVTARPYLRYVALLDGATRPQHRAWHDVIRPADDPWWQAHFPPNGWGCRCSVQQLSERDLQRFGLRVSPAAPPVVTREWTNPRTGERRRVPAGIDPGWEHHPGRASAAARLLAERVTHAGGVDAAIAAWESAADVAQPMLERAFAEWAGEDGAAAERHVVGVLTRDVAAAARAAGVEPGSAGVAVERGMLQGLVRGLGAMALGLPVLLSNPAAVLWDSVAGRLVYAGAGAGRSLMAMDVEIAASGAGASAVQGLRAVPARTLRGPRYRLLAGAIP